MNWALTFVRVTVIEAGVQKDRGCPWLRKTAAPHPVILTKVRTQFVKRNFG